MIDVATLILSLLLGALEAREYCTLPPQTSDQVCYQAGSMGSDAQRERERETKR